MDPLDTGTKAISTVHYFCRFFEIYRVHGATHVILHIKTRDNSDYYQQRYTSGRNIHDINHWDMLQKIHV